ncbi:MAG TPA: hypothetical protein VGQ46_07445 [Thermoanaerobaculia bacterium]|jgi:hypothetical protein|nr:hypothetical protein [Thermoanaerobaculia bacterium]
MTKAEIELLMTRDVDEICDVAVHHPKKQLSVTLRNAAALLAREEPRNDFEERLFVFKLLSFLQAALAGAQARVPAEVAREIFQSARIVMKRKIAADVDRAARDMLSVLLTERVQRDLLKSQFVSPADLVAVYQLGSDEPRTSSRNSPGFLKSRFARHGAASKSETVPGKV